MAGSTDQKFDLIVIGSGLAGTAASLFAAARGLRTARVSASGGELTFASGLLDLLGVYPPEDQKCWDDPWAGIEALIGASPQHPYARVGIAGMRRAMQEFLDDLKTAGLSYHGLPDRNVLTPTAVGTLKTTYRLPHSMVNGVSALQGRLPTLLVDFVGMKDFSARLMAEVLRDRWPALRALRLPFPQTILGPDRPNLLLAEAMELISVRSELIQAIRPQLGDAKMVGMPAVLGLRTASEVIRDLEDRLGVGVFEIPTLPPSVPGQRLRDALDASLTQANVLLLDGRQVIAPHTEDRRCLGLTIGTGLSRETLLADGFILASGRFLGGGLKAARQGVVETIFGLPVTQPLDRESWHRENFFDSRGHPLNEAGLETDGHFRPLEPDGRYAFENVFAAGSILAHQDWIRTKSGAGLAVTTAFGAVEGFRQVRSLH